MKNHVRRAVEEESALSSRGRTLKFYHGAQRWAGPPEVRAPKSAKVVEYGPGLYMTSSLAGAKTYAKGGGAVLEFEIDPDLTLLEDVRISAADMIAFLRGVRGLRHRRDIEDDIVRSASRTGTGSVPASTLVNLMVNYKVAHGDAGSLLVKFYVDHGIDAVIERGRGYAGDETWLVLYNMDKIRRHRRV